MFMIQVLFGKTCFVWKKHAWYARTWYVYSDLGDKLRKNKVEDIL